MIILNLFIFKNLELLELLNVCHMAHMMLKAMIALTLEIEIKIKKTY